MQGFPHRYSVNASAKKDGLVLLDSPGASQLSSAPPIEFDGPGDQWSPESLLTASVADCIILTFRAIAKASSLEWSELEQNTTREDQDPARQGDARRPVVPVS